MNTFFMSQITIFGEMTISNFATKVAISRNENSNQRNIISRRNINKMTSWIEPQISSKQIFRKRDFIFIFHFWLKPFALHTANFSQFLLQDNNKKCGLVHTIIYTIILQTVRLRQFLIAFKFCEVIADFLERLCWLTFHQSALIFISFPPSLGSWKTLRTPVTDIISYIYTIPYIYLYNTSY